VSSAYSLCKQWTVSVLSTVFSCPAFCAVARLVCHCWCDSSYLDVFVHVLQPLVCAAAAPPHAFHSRPTFCVRVRLAPLLPSVRFGFVSYSVLLLHCAPTLPLVLRSRTTAIRSTHYRATLGLSLICTPMLPPVHLAVRFRRRRYAFTDSAQLSRNVRSMQLLHLL